MNKILTPTGWKTFINEAVDPRDTPEYEVAHKDVSEILSRHKKAGTYPSPKMMNELSAAQKKHGECFDFAAYSHNLADHNRYKSCIPHTGEPRGPLYDMKKRKLAKLKQVWVAHDNDD